MGSQKFLEGPARAVEPGFYGSNRNIEGLRNLFVGGVLQIAQNNDRRIVLMKAVECLLDPLLDFSFFDCLFGIGEGAVVADQSRAVQRHLALLSDAQTFTAGARVVERDAVEPGGEIRVAAKLLDRFESGEKYFLSYLGGLVVVTQEPIDEIKRRLLVPPHQDFEGINVTPLDALDAFRIAYTFNKHWLKLY